MVVRFIDLFAGMGGLRQGFEQAVKEKGLEPKCVFTSEIKKYAVTVYKQNYPDSLVSGDITKIEAALLPNFDYLLAGFPCQAFSVAGKQLGFEDTRGTLFFEVAKILKNKQPNGFLLENVEGLVSHDKGKTLKVILHTLQKLGYKVTWRVLDSSKMGVPQARKRIYIVGRKTTEVDMCNFEESFSVFSDIQEHGVVEHLRIADRLFDYLKEKELPITWLYDKCIRDKRGSSNNIHSWWLGLKGDVTEAESLFLDKLVTERRKSVYAEKKGAKAKDGLGLTLAEIKTFYSEGHNVEQDLLDLVKKGYLKKEVFNGFEIYDLKSGKLSFELAKILDPSKPTLTLVATDIVKTGVVDGDCIRHLTIRECLKLQGYPEGYKLEGITTSQAYDLLGNTVVVPVIREVSLRLLSDI